MTGLDAFQDLLRPLCAEIAGRPLDAALAKHLNRAHPAGSPLYEAVLAACRQGDAEGWICPHEHGGIRYGRAIKPTPVLQGFSVDVVDMRDVVGPHHSHPEGEIDLVMPLEGDARFDGQPAGWVVYGPGSAHRPTVRGGRAYVLYLLPQGAIQFTKG